MRPKERRDTGQRIFCARGWINHRHGSCAGEAGRTVDWGFLEERFGAVYSDRPGNRRCRPG